MWNDSVVTDTGMTIMSQWAGGGSTLDITAAKLGGSTVPAVQLVRQTNVTGFKGTADIIQHKDIDGGVQFTIRISPLDTAAVIRQIGIFGKLNNGEEKLIALYQDNDGISVPGSEMPEFAYDFNATIAADRGSDINVNVDPMAFATKAELAENVEELKDEISPLTRSVYIDDFNDAVVTGVYGFKEEAINHPASNNGGGTLSVFAGVEFTHQIAYIGNRVVYFRRMRNEDGTWSDWTELAKKSDIAGIGTIVEKSDNAFKINASTMYKTCQVTLDAGTWICYGYCSFEYSQSDKGYCQVAVADSSTTGWPGGRTQYTKVTCSSKESVAITHTRMAVINSTTSYSIFIMSGAAADVYPNLRCIKISN